MMHKDTVLFEGKVFVALPEESGESTLAWVLQHASTTAEIIITHIKKKSVKTQRELGIDLRAGGMTETIPEELKDRQYRPLDKYLHQCSKNEVKASILILENGAVAKGLLELIENYWIRNLVMGIASDKYCSREMVDPRSKKATKLVGSAHPLCMIWFVCDQKLMCIRKISTNVKSVQHFLDVKNGVNKLEHSLEAAKYLFELKKDYAKVLSEGQNALQRIEELSKQRDETMQGRDSALTELNESQNWKELKRSAQTNILIELEAVRREKEAMITERDNAVREVAELRELKEQLTTERGHTLVEMKCDDALREVAKLRKEKEQIVSQRDSAVKEVLQLRQVQEQKMVERDSAVRRVERLLVQRKQIMLQRDDAEREMVELRRQKEQIVSENFRVLNSEFTPEELKEATNNFSDALMVGGGGFGCVYKGFLRNTTVAIKMLSSTSVQGQSEFEQEITILSSVRHPNLVTLVGACPEALALVYELMPNGSLEDRLECKGNTPPLSWRTRTRIIGEICSALTFLHKNKPNAVVHGDLKPSNILLDGNLVSKLSDFGISRFLIQSSSTDSGMYCTSHPMGTLAYMDPEFITTGELTPRSDTYSFGVTILRMLTGKSPKYIAKVVREAMGKKNLKSVMDPASGDWPARQAEKLALLGLRCADVNRKKRPDLVREVWRIVEPLATKASMSAIDEF